MAQGLAFLFGATPTFGVPVCLRTRLRARYLLLSDDSSCGFLGVPPKTNLVVTFRTRPPGVTLRGDGFSTW